ncbi:MAG: hypothetical protein ABI663_09315 [Chryseolinea sp.]
MNNSLFYFYGIFLISCGVGSVIFIGPKAKTALMSGGISGLLSILIAHFIGNGSAYAPTFGIILPGALFIVFAWRSTKTLLRIFELLLEHADKNELNGKGIAFLIISLMAITSLVVFILQVT